MADTLDIRQLDSAVRPLTGLPPDLGIRSGWIATVRQVLGMKAVQLAGRLGTDAAAITRFSSRERSGTITVGSLRRVADALECDLVYAFVPRAGSFEDTVRRRARAAAERELNRAAHTMALENQPVHHQEHQRQLEELTRQLIAERPSSLWDDVNGS
jgi:predicted DNA-binding mobile mystery protein A